MKAFVATVAMAAAASASPAADPALLYTAGGAVVPAAGYPVVSPLTYAAGPVVGPVATHTTYTVPEVSVPTVGLKDTGLVVHPESGAITPEFTAAQVKAAPELDANTVAIQKLAVTGSKVVQKAATYTVPHVATHVAPVVALGKREAEAEAEAKPEAEAEAEAKPGFFYSSGVVHPGAYHGVYPAVHPAVYSGVVPAVAPVVTSTTGLVAHPNGAVTPDLTPAQKVATLNHYAAKGVVPLVHYGKRSADAEADAEADAWGYGYHPAVYGYGSRVYGYGYPYGGYGYHYGKRSADAEPKADAEADAWGYGYHPAVYGYGSRVYGYPYAGYGYHYGKRSADAEPTADAEADAYYGYTGYTGVYRPAFYGYGSRVYGYGHGYPYGAGYAYYG